MPNPALEWHARQAASALNAGEVIAYPTESVWGLGCDPANEGAMNRLLAIKQRPPEKGVILIAASIDQVKYLLDPLPAAMREQAQSLWPGFVTCVVPDLAGQVPAWIRGRHSTVAVRVSRHPTVQALCSAFGGPLVSTSCNPAGRPPARTALAARRYFNPSVNCFMVGAVLQRSGPSPIVDLESGRYLRA